jgi:HEAT repeat protein
MMPLFFAGLRAGAQKGRPSAAGNAGTAAAAAQAQKKNLTRVNSTETPEGSSITIISDSALNDYSAYRGGDRFYVLIPEADASRVASGLRGRGFADVRAQKRGNDVLLSFKLLQGATARVSQKFNRLEIIITVPALVAANAQANQNNNGNANNTSNPVNTNNRTQPNNTTGTGNTSAVNSNTRTQSGSGTTTLNNSATNPIGNGTNQIGNGTNPIGTTQQNSTANQNLNNQPAGIPVGPNGTVTQQGTEGFPPVNPANPLASPSATPPSDQVAQQLPNMPAVNPATTTNAPVTTNAPAPADGTSLGAQLKQNWVVLLIALAAAGLIAWFLLARSRGDRSLVEERVESIRESKTSALKAAPVERADVVAPIITPPSKVRAKPAAESLVEPAALETEPVAFESDPEASMFSPVASIAAPIAAEIVSAPAVEEAPEEAVEAKELEPVVPVSTEPVAAEQASDEVANLLAGHQYDEAVINTQHADARQMVTAELLAALAGRNILRHERARAAFIKHGYFDDATRTLRTAESPGERASSARSLGLVRDHTATPHLVAALEDDSPEVRRAAVESLAEVRDPAAVASLEALRDREKDRKIPSALIQHAIEASVVGRAKVEPTTPVASPYATTPLNAPPAQETTPLPADFVAPPPLEELPSAVEEAGAEKVEAAPPVVETVEPPVVEAAGPSAVETEIEAVEATAPEPFELSQFEPSPVEASPVETDALETAAVIAPVMAEETASRIETETPSPVFEEPTAVEEATPVQPVEESVSEVHAAPPAQVEVLPLVQSEEVVAPVPEEIPAPVATAEPVVEHADGTASDWVDVDVNAPETSSQPAPTYMPVAPVEEALVAEPAPVAVMPAPLAAEPLVEAVPETVTPPVMPVSAMPPVIPVPVSTASTEERGIDVAPDPLLASKEIDVADEDASNVPSAILRRLASEEASERAIAVAELGRIGGEDSFREISASFDDPAPEVRNAAARSLYNINPDRAASFTRALREAPPERRRHIGAALASSGLATEAIGHLMGESREKTYDAFSLLFLMSKAGEVQPLMRAVEEHPNNEVRLAVVKLLALSGQQEILPAFRRLAVRGSLPTEVRSAVMEAIYQISSQSPGASA